VLDTDKAGNTRVEGPSSAAPSTNTQTQSEYHSQIDKLKIEEELIESYWVKNQWIKILDI
jgi:hypothetical protein